jgi:hypothetical protein
VLAKAQIVGVAGGRGGKKSHILFIHPANRRTDEGDLGCGVAELVESDDCERFGLAVGDDQGRSSHANARFDPAGAAGDDGQIQRCPLEFSRSWESSGRRSRCWIRPDGTLVPVIREAHLGQRDSGVRGQKCAKSVLPMALRCDSIN